jgi:hypothetical protein
MAFFVLGSGFSELVVENARRIPQSPRLRSPPILAGFHGAGQSIRSKSQNGSSGTRGGRSPIMPAGSIIPSPMKALDDVALCDGVNRFVINDFTPPRLSPYGR